MLNLAEVLSPKKSKREGFNTPNNSPKRIVKLFEAKFPSGEEINFENLSVVKGLRADEVSREYLVEDELGRKLRRKIINIDSLEANFGVEFWNVKEVLKIYMTMSSFLPEIFYAAKSERNLLLYITYYE